MERITTEEADRIRDVVREYVFAKSELRSARKVAEREGRKRKYKTAQLWLYVHEQTIDEQEIFDRAEVEYLTLKMVHEKELASVKLKPAPVPEGDESEDDSDDSDE